MFSLPQPHIDSDTYRMQTYIPAFEPSNLLDKLLCMLSGLSIPPWESFDDIESILTVAEKWDTPGPIESIRSSLTSPMFLSDPLRLYAIATHFGWDAEAKLASKHSLTLSLSSNVHQATLQGLSTKHLLPLLELHRRRRDQFKALIDSPERFTAGNSVDPPMHCARCGDVPLENHTWRELKGVMFLEMDRRPLGDTVLSKLDLCEWPEAEACWEARCSKEGCGSLNYDKVATLRQIRNCLDLLPTTI